MLGGASRFAGHDADCFAQRAVALESYHRGGRPLALPTGNPGKRSTRLNGRPAVVRTHLGVGGSVANEQRLGQSSQTFGRHEHERTKLASVLFRGLVQRSQTVKCDRRLAAAGLADDQHGAIGAQAHGPALHRVECLHRERRRSFASQGVARADQCTLHERRGPPRPVAFAREHDVAANDLNEVPVVEREQIACNQGALERSLGNLDLVRVAFARREEHRRNRGGLPVQDGHRPLDHGAPPEKHVARAALSLDSHVAETRDRFTRERSTRERNELFDLAHDASVLRLKCVVHGPPATPAGDPTCGSVCLPMPAVIRRPGSAMIMSGLRPRLHPSLVSR